MSIRCVIVDDEQPARSRLSKLVARHDDLECVGEASNADEAVALLDEVKPDLCFLDVQMPSGSGFDVLERVDEPPCVIFTTAYDQYAVQAFDVDSVDYLLKPFSRKRFDEAVERARRVIGGSPGTTDRDSVRDLLAEVKQRLGDRPSTARIPAKRGSKIVLLDPTEVLWFEAEETLIFARGSGGRFLVERTLTELEDELDESFFRSHRRFLVNLGQIAEIQPRDAGTYTIVMRDEAGSQAPLSRRQARKLREILQW